MATRPTPEQIQRFLAGPPGQPVVMLNLLKFKGSADATHEGQTGEQAHMQYAREMRAFVESKGGRFIWAGGIDSQLIGEGGEGFQFAALMQYPSRQAFLKLAGDPQIARTIGRHRDAGLESQWLFAMTEVSDD
jgi:uncharacterized protein (DUF1330 family)